MENSNFFFNFINFFIKMKKNRINLNSFTKNAYNKNSKNSKKINESSLLKEKTNNKKGKTTPAKTIKIKTNINQKANENKKKENKSQEISKSKEKQNKKEKEKDKEKNKEKSKENSKEKSIYKTKENNKEKKNKEKNKEKKNEKNKNKLLILNDKDLKILMKNFNLKRNTSPISSKNFFLKKNTDNENLILKNLNNKSKELQNEISKINEQKSYMKEEISLNGIKRPYLIDKKPQIKLIKTLKENSENLLGKISSVNQLIYEIEKEKNISSINNISKENYSENIRKELLFNGFYFNNKKIHKRNKIINLKKQIRNPYIYQEKVNNNSKLSKNNIKNNDDLKKDESISKIEKNRLSLDNIILKNRNNGYLYQKMASSFDEKEEIYRKEKIKNKTYEIKKMNKLDINYNLLKKRINNLEKLDNLHKMWKDRSDLLPKYVSPFYKQTLEAEEKMKKEEDDKYKKIKTLYESKMNYGKKVNIPPINIFLKKDWNKKEFKLNLNKPKRNSNIIYNNLNITLIKLQKKNNDIESNINKKNNSATDNNTNLNLSNLKSKKIIKRNSSYSLKNMNNNLYLNKYNDNDTLNKSSGKINNSEGIKNKNFSKLNSKIYPLKEQKNIDDIKNQVEKMEEKYKRGKKLLKVKGGYIKDDKLGDEINELLINSIKRKLDIIENKNNS